MSAKYPPLDVDVRAYLTSKGLQVKEAGGDNVHLACVFCNEDPSKRGRLYVNVGDDPDTAGLWYCHKCAASGNMRTLMRHFGDDPGTPGGVADSTGARILEAACEYYQGLHTERSIAYLTGNKRGLERDTIRDFRVGYAPESADNLYQYLKGCGFGWDDIKTTGLVTERNGHRQDFFSRKIVIPYLANGKVLQLRAKDAGGKYLTPPGQKARLFNGTVALRSREVVVCEGEFDAMVLTQLGFNAVALPGAASMQREWVDYFAGCQLIYTMFDPDAAGQKGQAKFLELLGDDAGKVRTLELPVPDGMDAGSVDPSYLVAGQGWTRDHFDALINAALDTATILVTVREALEEWDAVQGVMGLQLGFENFDLAIRPGLLPGNVMIPLAKTNAGKTITMLNIFQRMSMVEGQRDKRVLFLSLEQTRGDWFERARRIWNFYNLDCEPEKVNDETVAYWQDRIMLVDQNRVTEEAAFQAIDDYERIMGAKPDLIAIDYLGYWAQAFTGSSRYEKVTEAVYAVKNLAKSVHCPIIAPHQVNRGAEFGTHFQIDQARESGAVEETADLACSLWAADSMRGADLDSRTGELGVEIGKSRTGGKGQQFTWQFGYLSLVVVPAEDVKNARLARAEVPWANTGTLSWQDAIASHATGIPPRGFSRVAKFGGP